MKMKFITNNNDTICLRAKKFTLSMRMIINTCFKIQFTSRVNTNFLGGISMKTKAIIFLLLVTILMAGCSSNVTDADNGNNPDLIEEDGRFRLYEPDGTVYESDAIPERIVVVSVSTAEIMNALGIELVGMTRTTKPISEKLKALPTVGFPMQPNIESITALNPDLVILTYDFKALNKEQMEQHNLPAFFIDNQSYKGTMEGIEMLGKAFDKEAVAESLLKEMKEKEAAVLQKAKDKPQPKVLILFGTSESFMMARETSFAGEMVKLLGADNIIKDAEISITQDTGNYIPMSVEKVVELNPDVILRISHGSPEGTKMLYEQEFERNPVWQAIAAQQNGRVYDLPEDLFFSNSGLKIVESLEYLANLLYE